MKQKKKYNQSQMKGNAMSMPYIKFSMKWREEGIDVLSISIFSNIYTMKRASLVAQTCKESTCNTGDSSSIFGLGKFPEEGIGYPGGSDGKESCRAGDLGLIPGL